jgi:hypothetical protein
MLQRGRLVPCPRAREYVISRNCYEFVEASGFGQLLKCTIIAENVTGLARGN